MKKYIMMYALAGLALTGLVQASSQTEREHRLSNVITSIPPYGEVTPTIRVKNSLSSDLYGAVVYTGNNTLTGSVSIETLKPEQSFDYKLPSGENRKYIVLVSQNEKELQNITTSRNISLNRLRINRNVEFKAIPNCSSGIIVAKVSQGRFPSKLKITFDKTGAECVLSRYEKIKKALPRSKKRDVTMNKELN